MKKFFVFSVLMVLAISLIAAVKIKPKFNNTDIANMINRTAYQNSQLGVKNPDLIYPKQKLYYRSEDGQTEYFVDVIRGNSQWGISKGIFLGNYIPSKIDTLVDDVEPVEPEIFPKVNKAQIFMTTFTKWYWIIAIILIAIGILIYLLRNVIRNNSDPVNSGPALIPGGVSDSSIVSVIRSRHPNASIHSIEKGKLYGKGTPYYNFSSLDPRALINRIFGKRFNGEVGYQADITRPDGQRLFVQTLAGCGNPIKMNGEYITGVTFISDKEQPEFISEIKKTDNLEKVNDEKKAFNPEKATLKFLKKVAKKNDFYELTASIGEINFTIKNRTDKKPKKTDENEEKK